MSVEATAQQSAINMLVDRHTTTVVINRTVTALVDGALEATSSTINGVVIALYSKTPRAIRIFAEQAKIDKVEWSAIAKHDADIESGANIRDTFDVAGKGTFLVQNVIPIETDGVLTGKWVLLELMK